MSIKDTGPDRIWNLNKQKMKNETETQFPNYRIYDRTGGDLREPVLIALESIGYQRTWLGVNDDSVTTVISGTDEEISAKLERIEEAMPEGVEVELGEVDTGMTQHGPEQGGTVTITWPTMEGDEHDCSGVRAMSPKEALSKGPKAANGSAKHLEEIWIERERDIRAKNCGLPSMESEAVKQCRLDLQYEFSLIRRLGTGPMTNTEMKQFLAEETAFGRTGIPRGPQP